MGEFPRLLIIANECVSNVSSNGRTLRNFLIGWPKDRIAQFCIHNLEPDYTIFDRYYFVSDRDALNSFLSGKPASGKMKTGKNDDAAYSSAPSGRNAVTMLIRNLVWNSMRWAGKSFYSWVEEYAPELILMQAGDSAFMLDLARKLSQKYDVPLVMYNSEEFYFKKQDYFQSNKLAGLFYPLFRHQFCKAFEKCLKTAKSSVYSCDELKEDYDEAFGLPSDVIHTVTQMQPAPEHRNDPLKISYLGMMDLDRYKSLVEIGNTLQSISADLKLDVYGNIPDQNAQTAFDNCSGIDYKGFVSYEQVVQVMGNSDILIHAESFGDFYRSYLRHAFSTKIADSLASGTCFLVYAPEKLACTEYLRRHDAAWVVTRQEDLRPTLEKLCKDPQLRAKYVQRAIQLASENHTQQKNTAKFQKILLDSVKKDS